MTTVPAVEQYPTRTEPAVRGRRGSATPGRWATIERTLTRVSGLDFFEREEVINISMMIPADRPPELPGLSGAGEEVTDDYFLERVPEGVKIGMVRGGTIDPAGGFGFPDGNDRPIWIWFASADNGALLALFEDL